MNVLARLREKLRLIRYYSANRSSSDAERAVVAGLIGALLLAVPVAGILDVTLSREVDPIEITGRLFVDGDELVRATVEDTSVLGRAWGGAAKFAIKAEVHGWGWPRSSGTDIRAIQAEVMLQGAALPRLVTKAEPDDPMRIAIERALVQHGHDDIASAWAGQDSRRRHLPSWGVNSAIAWLALMIVLITMLRIGTALGRIISGSVAQRRRARRDAGLCEGCGYDLEGSVYADRCPECGMLLA